MSSTKKHDRNQLNLPMAAPRITIQLIREQVEDYRNTGPVIGCYRDAAACVSDLELQDREHFIVLYLDVKLRVICQHTIAIGTLDQTLCNPKEIFKAALLCNAHAMILLHNHPSGSTMPSNADLTITKTIIQCAKYMDIKVHDHVIVGPGAVPYSMRNNRPDVFSN